VLCSVGKGAWGYFVLLSELRTMTWLRLENEEQLRVKTCGSDPPSYARFVGAASLRSRAQSTMFGTLLYGFDNIATTITVGDGASEIVLLKHESSNAQSTCVPR
jgi:hypothetical protein